MVSPAYSTLETWLNLWQTRNYCSYAAHSLCLCLRSQFPHCIVTAGGSWLRLRSITFTIDLLLISLICRFDNSALCAYPAAVTRSKFPSWRSLSFRQSLVSLKTKLSRSVLGGLLLLIHTYRVSSHIRVCQPILLLPVKASRMRGSTNFHITYTLAEISFHNTKVFQNTKSVFKTQISLKHKSSCQNTKHHLNAQNQLLNHKYIYCKSV